MKDWAKQQDEMRKERPHYSSIKSTSYCCQHERVPGVNFQIWVTYYIVVCVLLLRSIQNQETRSFGRFSCLSSEVSFTIGAIMRRVRTELYSYCCTIACSHVCVLLPPFLLCVQAIKLAMHIAIESIRLIGLILTINLAQSNFWRYWSRGSSFWRYRSSASSPRWMVLPLLRIVWIQGANRSLYCVPQLYSDNPKLGNWFSTQRSNYRLYQEGRLSAMAEEHIEALIGIDFNWRSSKTGLAFIWSVRLQQLWKFKAEFGQCCVPQWCAASPSFGIEFRLSAATTVLQEGRPSPITEEHIRELESVELDGN